MGMTGFVTMGFLQRAGVDVADALVLRQVPRFPGNDGLQTVLQLLRGKAVAIGPAAGLDG